MWVERMYKNILFDLDGTLTASAPGIIKSIRYAFEKLDYPSPDDNEMRKFLGPPLTYSYREFCGFDEDTVARGVSLYREYYSERGIYDTSLFDGMRELLQSLKDSGRNLFVATSKPELFAKRIVSSLDIDKYFTAVAGSTLDEDRCSKAQVIDYLLRNCNITDKSTCIMVGDRKYDVVGANENGIKTVGVLFGYGSRKEFEECGADFVVETVADLKRFLLQSEG